MRLPITRVTVAFGLLGCGASEHPSEQPHVDVPACISVPTPTVDASSVDSFANAILADAGDASVVDASDASPPVDLALSRAAHALPLKDFKVNAPSAKAVVVLQSLRVSPNQMPSEVIVRIVRQNLGRFRLCFENTVRARPTIRVAEVTTFFAIDRNGAVALTETVPSNSSDELARCVQRGFADLSYPEPDPRQMMAVELTLRFDAAEIPERHGGLL